MQRLKINVVKDGMYAEKLGLIAGDVIDTINNIPATSPTVLSSLTPASSANMQIFRGQKRISVQFDVQSLGVILGEVDFDIDAWNDQQRRNDIVLSTAQIIEGRPAETTLGIVGSECVLGVSVFKDLMGAISDVIGIRSGALQSKLKEARQVALDGLRDEAFALGANAVIAINIEHNEIGDKGGFMMMVSATGTAIRTK